MDETLPSILCVDDDVDILELLKEYFTEQGFVVLTATNGVEAFLQVKRWRPKAVILDLFMPRLGGIGALGRIKALNPEVVVILVSGMGNALELVTEAGLSVAGAFTKPLDLVKVSDTLARAGVVAPAALVAGEASRSRRPVRARVLVVDDELEFRKVLVEYLEERGFDVTEAQSGEEALDRVPDPASHQGHVSRDLRDHGDRGGGDRRCAWRSRGRGLRLRHQAVQLPVSRLGARGPHADGPHRPEVGLAPAPLAQQRVRRLLARPHTVCDADPSVGASDQPEPG